MNMDFIKRIGYLTLFYLLSSAVVGMIIVNTLNLFGKTVLFSALFQNWLFFTLAVIALCLAFGSNNRFNDYTMGTPGKNKPYRFKLLK